MKVRNLTRAGVKRRFERSKFDKMITNVLAKAAVKELEIVLSKAYTRAVERYYECYYAPHVLIAESIIETLQ